MGQTSIDCRAAAALCLAAVAAGNSLAQQLPRFEARVKSRDQALYRQFCYGVLRLYPRLHGCLRGLVDKPLKAKDRDIQMLLLLGIYQLSEMRVPDHAAVNATVSATRALKKPWAKKLVNAVLRNWQRRQQDILQQLSEAEQAAHPAWLHELLAESWPQQLHAIEAANNNHPPMCLRVNRLQQSRDEYLVALSSNAIDAVPCQYAGDGIRLQRPVDVSALPGFDKGAVSVQDEAAQLSVDLLQLLPGQRLLDACCAPGGKTGHCLERQPELAELVAVDIEPQRLERVQDNLDRLGLSATLISADVAEVGQWWDGKPFQRILLDAPCSATGVIRRNPDIKLHRRAADIEPLHLLQGRLLNNLWPTLAPGGLLLYATCSVLPRENEQTVSAFCDQTSDAELQVIEADWGVALQFGRQLFPQREGHDGFYYALLRKKP